MTSAGNNTVIIHSTLAPTDRNISVGYVGYVSFDRTLLIIEVNH